MTCFLKLIKSNFLINKGFFYSSKINDRFCITGLKIRNETFFSDPQMFFFLRLKSRSKKAPWQNLSDFGILEHFLKKILKVEN